MTEKDPNHSESREASQPPPDAAQSSRRGALQVLVISGSALYAGALAVPACRFLADVGEAEPQGERWMRLAPLEALADDAPTRIKVVGSQRDAFTVAAAQTLGSVWLQRKGQNVLALSADCPHLGCSIDLSAAGDSFRCPCHASRFSLAGESEAGPSPRPMDALATRIVDGWIEVDFRRYRQGVAAKVPIG